MKKIYSLICVFTLLNISTNAATINVGVGTNGTALANQFFPSAITANVGDVVAFILAGGTHNVTSSSVPATAAAISSGTMTTPGQTYNYNVTVAGSYVFSCTFHIGMNGTINAAAGIATPTVDLLTSVYPNPFKDKVTLKYNGVESIDLYNIVGEKVKTFELPSTENKTEIDLSDLSAGVYFIRTFKEGIVLETKKIVKAK